MTLDGDIQAGHDCAERLFDIFERYLRMSAASASSASAGSSREPGLVNSEKTC